MYGCTYEYYSCCLSDITGAGTLLMSAMPALNMQTA